ncbi:MAG: hypothetical protein AB7R63_07175 [Phycisphaerales bacterium]
MGGLPAVNPAARRAYAELLRQFASGRMTNHAYEDRRDDIFAQFGLDSAIDAIDGALWHTYCDLREHRWRGGVMPRALIARWVVFLHGDEEMGRLPRAGFVPYLGWIVLGVFAFAGLGSVVALVVGTTALGLALGAASIGAYGLLWLTGISVAPRAGAAAFVRDPDDFWPFPSQEARARALRRPLLLSGRENRYATAVPG